MSNASAATWDTIDLLAAFKAAGGVQQGVTVARIHLRIACITAVNPNDEFGIGIMRGQNTDVGASVVGAPNPVADPYEDWLFWSVFFASTPAAGAGAGPQYFAGGANNVTFDIRAKRKLPELQESLNLVTVQPQAVTYPVQFGYSSSVLLMLP
jgi:hypothetical protein